MKFDFDRLMVAAFAAFLTMAAVGLAVLVIQSVAMNWPLTLGLIGSFAVVTLFFYFFVKW